MFQIDAFTDRVFHGNPASVCPLDSWLPDGVMQQIAMENNQAETAFFVPQGGGFAIRWFTPTVEVDLCGHATLAAAFVIFEYEGFRGAAIEFASRSGPLRARRQRERITLDFPADPPVRAAAPKDLVPALGIAPEEIYKGRSDYMLVYGRSGEIERLQPDMGRLAAVEARGVIVTAPGEGPDFVSRFFAPQSGIPEDPVTGSAHTTLVPYWGARLGKSELEAEQLSRRHGWLRCRLAGDRVEISGQARPYMSGQIELPQ